MHLLLRSKHIAPKPRIARAPELVFMNFNKVEWVREAYTVLCSVLGRFPGLILLVCLYRIRAGNYTLLGIHWKILGGVGYGISYCWWYGLVMVGRDIHYRRDSGNRGHLAPGHRRKNSTPFSRQRPCPRG